MKTKRIPFDLAKARAGARVVTRCGYPVRLSDFEVKNKDGYTLLGIIDIKGNEVPFSFLKNGCRSGTETQSEFDLFIEEEVEPKFKVGDWIVQDNAGICRVTEICESWYEVINSDESNYSISFDQESMCHLWTIQDAKESDVLYYSSNNTCGMLMFKELAQDETLQEVRCYCEYNTEDGLSFEVCIDNPITRPASKELCKELFIIIKEAGYMWDSDKKELKKIDKEVKTRLMTHQELSDWLCQCPEEYREMKYKKCLTIYKYHSYYENEANIPADDILIRKNHGEWEEPIVDEILNKNN